MGIASRRLSLSGRAVRTLRLWKSNHFCRVLLTYNSPVRNEAVPRPNDQAASVFSTLFNFARFEVRKIFRTLTRKPSSRRTVEGAIGVEYKGNAVGRPGRLLYSCKAY